MPIGYLLSRIYILVLLISCSACELNLNTVESDSDDFARTKVALLGTIHLAGTGDIAAPEVKNVLGSRRQKEIDSLLDKTAQFEPDKVLVETVSSKQDSLMKKYRGYLDGTYELTASEIDQLGMKLAKDLGHDSIYAADYMMPLPFGDLMEFAGQYGMKARLDSFIAEVKNWADEESKFIESHSLLDYYIKLNSEEECRKNRNYYLMEMMRYSRDSIYPGPELSGEWYKRNLYILANMDRIIEEGDRVLFIVGNGHKALLEGFIRSRTDWEYVEIRKYLED